VNSGADFDPHQTVPVAAGGFIRAFRSYPALREGTSRDRAIRNRAGRVDAGGPQQAWLAAGLIYVCSEATGAALSTASLWIGAARGRFDGQKMDTSMKIGIVGAGNVGCACAMAATVRGKRAKIVLINRTRKRAEAVATDIR
jgi:hypothetical protein